MRDAFFEVERVSIGYGEVLAVRDISLTVEKGDIISVVGSNGAGKTTLMSSIMGLIPVTHGTIRFQGQVLDISSTQERVRAGLALVPEGRKIFPRLTVEENLLLGAYLRKDGSAIQEDAEKMYHQFPILKARKRQLGGTLSGGEQQMLALARALMSRPSLLLLDEPSMGISPLIVQEIFVSLRTLNAQGLSILMVEQNAERALSLCKRGYVIDLGIVVAQGTSSELLRDPKLRSIYLGN
jgi:branched-chain amino acid transport system ATP-binding protein